MNDPKRRFLSSTAVLTAVGAALGYAWLGKPKQGAAVGCVVGVIGGVVDRYVIGLPLPTF